jgi:hypothetical protein
MADASERALDRGANAWIVCLWELRRHRGWSLRLRRPALRPWAEIYFRRAAARRSPDWESA